MSLLLLLWRVCVSNPLGVGKKTAVMLMVIATEIGTSRITCNEVLKPKTTRNASQFMEIRIIQGRAKLMELS